MHNVIQHATRQGGKSISTHTPDEAPDTRFFSSGRRKSAQSRPRILDFAQIWAFIHLASPGHPRPSGARSSTPDERNARETARKIPARRVALTCRREWAVVVLIVSSSAHRRLLAHIVFRAL
jgi:hypothetical protein